MNGLTESTHWCPNVIVADADYVDRVAFDLTVNFERMLERRIAPADTARWLECVALDGGLRESSAVQQTQVVLIHSRTHRQMDNFCPGRFEEELDGKAFNGRLGEFLLSTVTVEELTTKADLFCESVQVTGNSADVKRLMVIGDTEHYYDGIRQALRVTRDEQHVTVFAMQPLASGNFRQEILGYSLMAALGISADEINCKQ